MKKLLEYLITSITSHPGEVRIEEKVDQTTGIKHYEISVHPDDLGQVIGRSGKIIKSIRRLAYVAAAKTGEKVNIQLLEETQGKEKTSLSGEKGTISKSSSPTSPK